MGILKAKSLSRGCVSALAVLVLTPVFCGCTATKAGYKPPTKVDVSERAPVGHPVDVVDFQWAYLDSGRLQVNGTVRNNAEEDLAGLVLYTMMFDEDGRAVAMGEALVEPVVLPAGETGSFYLTANTDRPTGIKKIRLLTNAQTDRILAAPVLDLDEGLDEKTESGAGLTASKITDKTSRKAGAKAGKKVSKKAGRKTKKKVK